MTTSAQQGFPGQCQLCENTIDKRQMTRHLKRCIEEQAATGRTVEMYHLVIEGADLPMYWLHVEVPGAQTLECLDEFLRDIWVECCGHLSCFEIGGQTYSVHPSEDAFWGPPEMSMRHKIYKVISTGVEIKYVYDYGSSTRLSLKLVDVRRGCLGARPVRLLARNEPVVWQCSKCGKPATRIQAMGWGIGEDNLLCDDCPNDADSEMLLPVVNSPRAGVCGYCG